MLPWPDAAAALPDDAAGSLSDRERTPGDAHTGASLVVCAVDDPTTPPCWPREVIQTLESGEAVLFRSRDAGARQSALARETWPELCRAVSLINRGGDTTPITIRAQAGFAPPPITLEDALPEVEHLWFDVTGVAGDVITGRLEHDPLAATHLRRGQVYQIPREEISDWQVTWKRTAFRSAGRRGAGRGVEPMTDTPPTHPDDDDAPMTHRPMPPLARIAFVATALIAVGSLIGMLLYIILG